MTKNTLRSLGALCFCLGAVAPAWSQIFDNSAGTGQSTGGFSQFGLAGLVVAGQDQTITSFAIGTGSTVTTPPETYSIKFVILDGITNSTLYVSPIKEFSGEIGFKESDSFSFLMQANHPYYFGAISSSQLRPVVFQWDSEGNSQNGITSFASSAVLENNANPTFRNTGNVDVHLQLFSSSTAPEPGSIVLVLLAFPVIGILGRKAAKN